MMKLQSQTETSYDKLLVLEKLVGLSVDLHNLNAGIQRRYDISIVQWLVLKKIIDQPGLSAGTLAEISGVHPSTLTPTITRLEAMGLIHIQERPTDMRRKLLLATWKGLECCRKSETAFSSALGNVGKAEGTSMDFDNIRDLTKRLLSNIHTSESGETEPK